MKSAHRAEADSAQRGSSTIAAFFTAIIALLAATFGLQHAPVATTSQPAAAAQSTTQQFQDLSSQASSSPASPSPASSNPGSSTSTTAGTPQPPPNNVESAAVVAAAPPSHAAPQPLATENLSGTSSAGELAQLQILGNQLQSDIAALPADNPASTSYLTVPAWAASQRINQLSDVTISNSTIDAASIPDLSGEYLPLGGGTLTGSLNMNIGATYEYNDVPVLFINASSDSYAGGAGTSSTTGGLNTGFGNGGTLADITTGYNNTAFGHNVLSLNTTGYYNVAVGNAAMSNNTSGAGSVAMGWRAQWQNATGVENTALGEETLQDNATGSDNTAVGGESLEGNATSTNNVAVGQWAAFGGTTGTSLPAPYFTGVLTTPYTNQGGVYVGAASGFRATTGSDYNTFLGFASGFDVTTGYDNILIGAETNVGGNHLMTGGNNICIGFDCILPGGTAASNQLNIGNVIFATNLTATSAATTIPNVLTGFVGIDTASPQYPLDVNGFINTSQAGGYKQAGNTILYASTTNFSTLVGYDAGASLTASNLYDTAIGYDALASTTANGNIAVGYETLQLNTTGVRNTAVGNYALSANTTGIENVAFGLDALDGNTTGGANTGLGYFAESALTTGFDDVAVGFQSGDSLTSGSDNIFLGDNASGVTSGSNNIVIGVSGSVASSTASDQLSIGNLIYGTGLYSGGGAVGIGTTTPYSRLTVWGPNSAATTSAFAVVNSASTTVFAAYDNGNATYAGSIFQSSDQRLKTNITSLDGSSSLSEIESLNPVSYLRLDQPGTGENLGFIAQQVQQIFPQLVSTSTPTALTPDGTLTLNYEGLISPIVSALQDIASISGDFEANLVAWLGNTSNGIDDLFAQNIYANNITAADITSQQDTTQELCVGAGSYDPSPICVTKPQLAAILAAAGTPNSPESVTSSPTTTSPESVTSGGTGESAATDTPPVISINGNNPATVQVGAAYTDLGATIIGPQQDLNLGIDVIVNGGATTSSDQIQIDTSAPATDTIEYVTTDQSGIEGSATRTVITSSPVQSAATSTETASASSTDATSTTSTQ